MIRDQLLLAVKDAFAGLPRPAAFIRGTCACEECLEHEAEMRALVPENPSLVALGNPGWDPICFASDAAFAYLVPGLARLVLDHADGYIQQFVFHIGQPDRLSAFTPKQALALAHVLDYLVLHEASALDHNLIVDELLRAKEGLERRAEGGAGES